MIAAIQWPCSGHPQCSCKPSPASNTEAQDNLESQFFFYLMLSYLWLQAVRQSLMIWNFPAPQKPRRTSNFPFSFKTEGQHHALCGSLSRWQCWSPNIHGDSAGLLTQHLWRVSHASFFLRSHNILYKLEQGLPGAIWFSVSENPCFLFVHIYSCVTQTDKKSHLLCLWWKLFHNIERHLHSSSRVNQLPLLGMMLPIFSILVLGRFFLQKILLDSSESLFTWLYQKMKT